jgi:hypothetical protein
MVQRMGALVGPSPCPRGGSGRPISPNDSHGASDFNLDSPGLRWKVEFLLSSARPANPKTVRLLRKREDLDRAVLRPITGPGMHFPRRADSRGEFEAQDGADGRRIPGRSF